MRKCFQKFVLNFALFGYHHHSANKALLEGPKPLSLIKKKKCRFLNYRKEKGFIKSALNFILKL